MALCRWFLCSPSALRIPPHDSQAEVGLRVQRGSSLIKEEGGKHGQLLIFPTCDLIILPKSSSPSQSPSGEVCIMVNLLSLGEGNIKPTVLTEIWICDSGHWLLWERSTLFRPGRLKPLASVFLLPLLRGDILYHWFIYEACKTIVCHNGK